MPGLDTAQRAVDAMAAIAPQATTWTLVLPGERQTVVEASWCEPGATAGSAGTKRPDLDAGTGEKIESRETRGGNFLYRFYFELHGMPRVWGRWIVSFATMVMFVAILSGVVTHKKIFTDFFPFRPRKGQRSWLDAHNATAVLASPFHVMITSSGLLTELADGGPHAFAQLDVELNSSNPIFVGILGLPPDSPSFCPHSRRVRIGWNSTPCLPKQFSAPSATPPNSAGLRDR